MNKIKSIQQIRRENPKLPGVAQYLSLMKPFLFPNTSIIPRHLYTCWHTKNLPPLMQQNYDSIVRNNPEMQVHLYDEIECRAFIQMHFQKDIVEAYDTLIPCSYKSDLWRFCILYIYGGVYVDIKYKPMNGFRFIGLTDKEYFVRDADPENVYTALIVTMPRNGKLLQSIQQIVQNVKVRFYGNCPLEPTGPKLLKLYFTPKEKENMKLYHAYQENINKYYIVYDDRIILQFYQYYREEQARHQKKKRYIDLWLEKKIYA